MSEQFQPQIKEARDVSGSISKAEALHASQDERIKILNEHICDGIDGKVVTREGKKDLWIRKEVKGTNIVKGVDAMIPGSTVNVLRAEYKIDEKDGQPKLYYYCEVENSSTVNGGTKGTDKGWIYAGYIHMDVPTPEPLPVIPPPDPTPVIAVPKVDPDGMTPYIRRPTKDNTPPPSPGIAPTINPIIAPAPGPGVAPTVVPTPAPGPGVKPTQSYTPKSSNTSKEGPSVYAAFTDSHSPDIDSEGLRPEVTVDMKSEIQEVVSQLKDAQNRSLAKPKFEMASRVVEAYAGAMQKRAPGLEGKRQGAGIFNGPKTNPLLTDDMQKGYFSVEALRTILGEIESNLGDKTLTGTRYDQLFKRLQECEIHYADVIDDEEVTKIEKEMRGISENGSEVSTDTALNIWDQFRAEYIGDDGSSHNARENIGRLVYEREEGQDNQDLKDFRNALKAEANSLKNSPTPNAMLALGSIDNICTKYGIKLTDKDRSSGQKILSDISVAFRDQKVQIRETIARDFLGIAPGTAPTAAQNTLIESILPKVEGFMLTEGLESAIYPILFYRLHQTDTSWGGSKFDGNKALNKLAWANWDEASKLGQRITVEFGAFLAGGWAVNVLRGGVAAGRIAMLAGRATEAGRAAQSLATAPEWVQGLSRTINGMMVGSSGSVLASGAREGMHEGVAHYGRDAAFGAFYGAIFPVISTQISRLGNLGSARIGSMTPNMIKDISARLGLSAARDGSRNLLNRVLVNPTLILGRETFLAGTTLGVVEAGQKILTDDERDFAIAQLVSEAWNVITTDTTLAEGLRDMRLEEILPLIATNIMVRQYKQPQIKKPEPKPGPNKPKPEIIKQGEFDGLRETLVKGGMESAKRYEKNVKDDMVLQEKILKGKDSTAEQKANAEKELAKLREELQIVQNAKNDILKSQKEGKTEQSPLEKSIRSMDDAALKQYIEAVKRDIARQELITKSKDLKPGNKITKDTFATAEQKAKALSEIQRHQAKLVIARKVQAERGKSGVSQEEIQSAKDKLAQMENTDSRIKGKTTEELLALKNTLETSLKLLEAGKAPGAAVKPVEGDLAMVNEVLRLKGIIEAQPAQKTKSEKPAELTERQRLQKENAEANTEFDRLLLSTGKVDPKTLEAARIRKRDAAAALEKHLSSETSDRPKEPEGPKTEATKKPALTVEQIKSGKELAEKVKKFTRGEEPYKKVLGDNGPNNMDIGGGLQITRHVEGNKWNPLRKETFSIEPKGSKTPGEKFTAEELTSKLTPEQQSQLTKVMDSIAKAEVIPKGANTNETSWVVDGVTHVKVVQTGFTGGDGIQRFEGVRDGTIYTGTLTRAGGEPVQGKFKITEPTTKNETLGELIDRNHFDMVNA